MTMWVLLTTAVFCCSNFLNVGRGVAVSDVMGRLALAVKKLIYRARVQLFTTK
jgi:hypothetical protein